MSDDAFSDDDDAFLAGLHRAQNSGPSQPASASSNAVTTRLFEADGEIAILRAQLDQLRAQKRDEVVALKLDYSQTQAALEEQVKLLKFSVQKLEDEKKFLDNELKRSSTKKRKIDDSSVTAQEVPKMVPSSILVPKMPKISVDSALFTDFIHKLSINGSTRTSMAFLSRIAVTADIVIGGYTIKGKFPLSSSIMEFLIVKKDLRLDELIAAFAHLLMDLTLAVIRLGIPLSVPFLLSLLHGSLMFRVSAVDRNLISGISTKLMGLIQRAVASLDSNSSEETYTSYYNAPLQKIILENFMLICSMDLLERLVVIASAFDNDFFSSFLDKLSVDKLIALIIPQNTERLVNSSQINVLFNLVEIVAVLVEKGDGSLLNAQLFHPLMKVFLIEVGLRNEYMFYGLNRFIGNNGDFQKIEAIIPEDGRLMEIPSPVPRALKRAAQNTVNNKYKHEHHLLNLRIRITELTETFIVTHPTSEILKAKDLVKTMVRIVNFEQAFIAGSPRSKLNYLRIRIVSNFIRILHCLFNDDKQISELLYPETLSELVVVLAKTSFAADSLSIPAHQLLVEIRQKGFKKPVFDGTSEQRARQIAHADIKTDAATVAGIEAEMANGIEFPYEAETVELSRELLTKFVNHQEADNLYVNMNGEERFDEMDIVE